MRSIIAFAVLALAVAAITPRLYDRFGHGSNAAPASATTAAPAIPAAMSSSPSSVTLTRDKYNHFRVEAAVDGRRMEFVVDTGATVVVLREREAARLGFHPSPRDYSRVTRTANGDARAAPLMLSRVEINGLVVRDVQALVMPDETLGENLLGMAFLSKLRRWEFAGGRLVLEQ